MKTPKLILAIVATSIAVSGIIAILPTNTRPEPASATQSNKYDGDCPANTAEGAYFVRGYDKETGAVSCGFTFFNECPYAAGYSATDPMCDKLAPQQQPTPTITPAPEKVSECGGK